MTNDEVSGFIRSSFRSVWTLELLLLLKGEPRAWSRDELIGALRASHLIVSQGLASLTAAGLVAVDDSEMATYRPVSDQVAQMVDASEAYYARSPDSVRRLIVGSSSGGLAAFADAFRLRKE